MKTQIHFNTKEEMEAYFGNEPVPSKYLVIIGDEALKDGSVITNSLYTSTNNYSSGEFVEMGDSAVSYAYSFSEEALENDAAYTYSCYTLYGRNGGGDDSGDDDQDIILPTGITLTEENNLGYDEDKTGGRFTIQDSAASGYTEDNMLYVASFDIDNNSYDIYLYAEDYYTELVLYNHSDLENNDNMITMYAGAENGEYSDPDSIYIIYYQYTENSGDPFIVDVYVGDNESLIDKAPTFYSRSN